jgi:murein DD-endopeptidase MepM/ murein hydrolase activator NlpD
MAGGDHLHYAMLINGVFVNPIEWWDEHWIKDNVELKLKAFESGVPSQPAPQPKTAAAAAATKKTKKPRR